MNLVIMMGRATKDPESRNAGQTTVSNFSLAVDRKYKKDGEPDADFFDCTAFGKTAEAISKYVKKGTKILVHGRLQNDNYKDKEGKMVYRNRIILDNFEFAERKEAENNNPPAPDGFMSVPDDMGGMPFG